MLDKESLPFWVSSISVGYSDMVLDVAAFRLGVLHLSQKSRFLNWFIDEFTRDDSGIISLPDKRVSSRFFLLIRAISHCIYVHMSGVNLNDKLVSDAEFDSFVRFYSAMRNVFAVLCVSKFAADWSLDHMVILEDNIPQLIGSKKERVEQIVRFLELGSSLLD